MYNGRDFAGAARHLQRALHGDPSNPDILDSAATLAGFLGRFDDAIAIAQYLVARDPINAGGHALLGRLYVNTGRFEEAIASLRTSLALSPRHLGALSYLGLARMLQGDPTAILKRERQEFPIEALGLVGLVMGHYTLGEQAESDAALGELIEKYHADWAFNIAYVLAYRNEADRAFEWLDRAVAANDPGLAETVSVIQFANIHSDPRWIPFLRQLGFAPEQLAAIEFDVTLPE